MRRGRAWRRGAGACLALALAGACDRGPDSERAAQEGAVSASETLVVARVDGQAVTAQDLSAERPGVGAARPAAQLERVVVRKLAAAEARRRGLAEAPEIEQELERIRRRAAARQEALLRDALFDLLRAEVELDEAALREHYEQSRGRYLRRELALRVWRFANRDAAERARAKLEADEGLAAPEPEVHGPAPAREFPPELARAAVGLGAPGERTLVETEAGAALVELTASERRVAPFDAVRDRVETSLRTLQAQEAWSELVEELRAEADLEIDEVALDVALEAVAERSRRDDAQARSQPPSPGRR